MKLELPDKSMLEKTGEVDYYYWNYKFPINLVQRYRFRAILRLLDRARVDTLLEIGTGSGIFLPQLSKFCKRLYACDVHDKYDNIHKLCEIYNIQDCHLSQQNIEATSYPDKFFDIIVGVSVIEFIEDLDKAFAEIKRILKDDGMFLTICPMQSDFLDSLLSIYSTKKPDEEFVNSRQKIAEKIENEFKVVERGYMIPIFGRIFPVYTHYKLKI